MKFGFNIGPNKVFFEITVGESIESSYLTIYRKEEGEDISTKYNFVEAEE